MVAHCVILWARVFFVKYPAKGVSFEIGGGYISLVNIIATITPIL